MRALTVVVTALVAACGSVAPTQPIDAPPGAADAEPPVVEEIHRIGRFDGAQRFAWPGTQILTHFTGTEISIDLEDSGDNWFEIIVDGVPLAPLHAASGRQTYALVSGLPAGEHDLFFARRTESFLGVTTFHGFPGATLTPTPRPDRLIEFIGDSITCGYGVLGTEPCSFEAATEAETHAWGAFAAAAVGAAHVSIAYSGIGMIQNSGGGTTDTMPVRYPRTLADDPGSSWGFAYTPDVIVVALGTNDFSVGDPGQPFVTTYVSFVQMLRTRFPAAPVLLATSPMLAGASHATHRGYLDQVAAMVGDPAVTVVEIAEQDIAADGLGCDYHPSEATMQKMADTLVPAIRAATGW